MKKTTVCCGVCGASAFKLIYPERNFDKELGEVVKISGQFEVHCIGCGEISKVEFAVPSLSGPVAMRE